MSKDYKNFGESIYNYLNNRGWNSMTKKEMITILVHFGLENNILEDSSINMLSIKLKINPSGVKRILVERALLMNMVENWDINDLINWLKSNEQTTQVDNLRGLGVYYVHDWSQLISAETALEKIGIIPEYKNNKQLLVLDLNKVVYQLSKFESIDITQLVKNLLKQSVIESTKFNEEEFKANPIGKFKDILKEQTSRQLGMNTTEILMYLIEKGWKNISKS